MRLQLATAAPSLSATTISPHSSTRAPHMALDGTRPATDARRGPCARQLQPLGRHARAVPTAASSAISGITALVADPSSHRHAGPYGGVPREAPGAPVPRAMQRTAGGAASVSSSTDIRELVREHMQRIDHVAGSFLGRATPSRLPTSADPASTLGSAHVGRPGSGSDEARALEHEERSAGCLGSRGSPGNVLSDAAWRGRSAR